MKVKEAKGIKRFKRLTMQRKLTISFSVPLTVLCILVTMICSPILTKTYKQQIQYNVSQSCEQVNHYITHYIENMYHISQIIAQSGEINKVLSADKLGQYADMAEAYREFYHMNLFFDNIEISNLGYRIGLYVPDKLIYSNNRYFFFPESMLREREDYEKMMETLKKGQLYFTVMEEGNYGNGEGEQYITLLTAFEAGKNTYVAKAGVELDEMKAVLKTAQSTPDNLIYLLDENGNFLAASDDEKYESLEGRLPHTGQQSWSKVQIDQTDCYVIYQQLDKYNWQVFSLIPVKEYKKQTGFISKLILLMTFVLIGAIIIVSFFLSRYYGKRLAKVNRNMKKLEEGKLNAQISASGYIEGTGDEIDEIYANFNHMAEQLQQLMKEHYKLGKSVMSAELKALQAQINPHFLYNTLDLINWGALEHGALEVADMARNLGQFYRLSLNHGKMAISIEEELKHVEAYVNIESRHFPGAIALQIDVSPKIRKYACLNIILQPFVENSIVHGIGEHSEIIECTIKISAVLEDGDILFTVEDDGPGMEPEKLESILKESDSGMENGYGVKNINFRIRLCYGEQYGVQYQSQVAEGTKVMIKIPAMTCEELEEFLK